MEIIFQRFPSLGKSVLNLLDDKSLVQSRKVSRRWKNFIDQDKTIWIRKIKKQVGNFEKDPDWQKSVSKIPTATVRELFNAVCQFYDEDPSRKNENWSPLHIAVECGNLNLTQVIIAKIGDKNPKNNEGFTPLHFAAQNGHLELCQLVFNYTEEKNPRDNVGITPHYLAAQHGHFKVCEFFVKNCDEKNPKTRIGK